MTAETDSQNRLQMPPLQRDILLNILKIAQSQGHLPNHSGGLSPLAPEAVSAAQQKRLSPGFAGGGSAGLAVANASQSQRIPSPQELQVHTQQVSSVMPYQGKYLRCRLSLHLCIYYA
jgi:hypothetical protein